MRLPTSLTVAIVATGALRVVALLAYAFGYGVQIVVGAFVLGCVAAWIEVMNQLR